MWINAFDCIRPADTLKIAIGQWVLDQLNDRAVSIVSQSGHLLGLDQREVVLRFNKS